MSHLLSICNASEPSLKKIFLFFFSFLFFAPLLFCQEYNYAHYDVKDGLAGSTVYSMVQDKDGFMWYGTETGLSRFDGTHFKNFYTSDGLPDNEIVNLFVDSKNRVWIIPFKNTICYYWKGRIHNQENDSLLKQLDISSEVMCINEDKFGNILIGEKYHPYVIDTSGKIFVINNFEGTPFVLTTAGINKTGNFQLGLVLKYNDHILASIDLQKRTLFKDAGFPFEYLPDYLSARLKIFHKQDSLHLINEDSKTDFFITLSSGFIKISAINDSMISFNTVNGTYLFNTGTKKITDTFLNHLAINAVAEDAEENLWFSVLGKGVFRLGSGRVMNYSPQQQNKSVFCIQKFDSLIYAGSDNFNLWILDINKKKISARQIWKGATRGRITALLKADKKNIIVGTDNGLFRLEKMAVKDSFSFVSVKSILNEPNNEMIVSTGQGISKIKIFNFEYRDPIWKDRSTCSYTKEKTLYVGTLNGLYTVDSNGKINYLGDVYKLFRSRINAIAESKDSMLWVATNGEGLVAFKKNKIIFDISEINGLTSNICRNLFISPNAVWVGTDKGLNKISYSAAGYNIMPFTSADGFGSDIVNAVYADGNDIYVGTPDGLTYFDETKISKKSICNLHMTAISIAGNQLVPDTSDFTLKHSENNIAFQFVGISYKSGGKISYQYRLIGLDTNWKTTNETSLNYLSLSSGDYELQLKAVNKFGVQSNLIRARFSISKTLWEKNWFKIMLLIAIVIFLWAIINYRIDMIRKKENEKSNIIRRMAELEQMALKSQMNPHFIFNCLNSIQHYVIDKDIVGASEFISGFSKLMRLTLDNSSRANISVADEINYLTAYLQLEQKRFEDRFTFKIIADKIMQHDYLMPPMILQPYIENAIRHGVRYREDGKGIIIIKFEKNSDYLVCTVSDNGIGRKLSQKLKSKNPIEYQSKGMDLTAKRIDMLNMAHSSKISISITDIEDNEGTPTGTEVSISFPLDKGQKKHSGI